MQHTSAAEAGRLEGMTHAELTQDVVGRLQDVNSRYWGWVVVLAILVALGVVGFLIRLANGFDDRSNWGYMAATLSFMTTVFLAAPIVAIGQRYIKSHWRRPMTRIAELYAVTGVLALLLLLPLLAALPPMEGRSNIWFDWPVFAPYGWDTVVFFSMALCGLALLWMLGLPDLATARDHLKPSTRQRFISRLAVGWKGTTRQWRVHRWGILIVGALYMFLFMLVQTLVSSEFSAGLLPGLKDAIFPAFQTLQGLQAGIAIVLVTMFILRSVGGYDRYLGVDQFWALSKPLLAFSLLWFYFWWSTFLTFWYGRQPAELSLIDLVMFGSYRWPFLIAFFLNFLIPVVALIWNPVRRSIWGPTLVSIGILIGAFFNQVRMYVSAFSVEDVTGHALEVVPAGQMPQAVDVLIIVGAISGAVLLFLLAIKIVPVISIWEVSEGLHLTRVRTFLGRTVRVIAKSH